MRRFALTLAALALGSLPLSAQPPGSFRFAELKADGGKVAWTETTYQTVQKQITVTVNRNGMNVNETQTVTEMVPLSVQRSVEVAKLKVTNGAGKAVDTEALAKLLKEPTAVVIVAAPPGEKQRKLFKETTLFVQLPAREPGKGAAPLPVPVPRKG
jgi:hypothetical protein